MNQELKAFVVNMKSLYQDIDDPIITGAGDANGRTFRIIFTQEAAAQLTPESKVYLSWFHQEEKIKGYNVFTKVGEDPETWEIHYPRAMLHEGNVLCCIEIVDSISIAPSNNFIVHILSDPNDGSTFVVSDDFTEFQHAVIELNCLADQMREQMVNQKIEFEDMQMEIKDIHETADDALAKAAEALEKVNSEKVATGLYIYEF